MQRTHYEHWPLTFDTAPKAVRWADNFLLQSRVKSQFWQIMNSNLQGQVRRSIDQWGETITAARLTDEAETISVCLAGIRNPAGILYRHIHGRHPYTFPIANHLAQLAWPGPGKGGVRTMGKMRVLAVLLIEDARKRWVSMEDAKTKADKRKSHGIKNIDIAKQMGVSIDSYYNNWHESSLEIREAIQMMIDMVDRELTSELADRGIL